VSQPLNGKRILVTRPRKQAEDFVQKLEALGAEVVLVPGIEVLPIRDTRPLDEALLSLDSFDWLILTSVNGVEAVVSRMIQLELSVDLLKQCRIAVVGPATAAAVDELGATASAMPSTHTGIGIADELGDVTGKKVLLARADRASKDLPAELTARGALVSDISAYEVSESHEAPPISGPAPDYLTFTSGSSATAIIQKLRNDHPEWLDGQAVCIGPVTARAAAEAGVGAMLIASPHTTDGMIETILEHSQRSTLNAQSSKTCTTA
jgi:uroporphyrinogen-III synthase